MRCLCFLISSSCLSFPSALLSFSPSSLSTDPLEVQTDLSRRLLVGKNVDDTQKQHIHDTCQQTERLYTQLQAAGT